MFHPTHPSIRKSTVVLRASGADGAPAYAVPPLAAAPRNYSIGGQVSLIKTLNDATGRDLAAAATGVRAASGEIATAAQVAAEAVGAGSELHDSVAALGRVMSEFRRSIDLLINDARAV